MKIELSISLSHGVDGVNEDLMKTSADDALRKTSLDNDFRDYLYRLL